MARFEQILDGHKKSRSGCVITLQTAACKPATLAIIHCPNLGSLLSTINCFCGRERTPVAWHIPTVAGQETNSYH